MKEGSKMSAVTELKMNLSSSQAADAAVAAVMVSWYTEDSEKLSTTKIFHGGKAALKEQIAALVERLLNELPDD
jgi:hypothetical protein